MIRDHKLLLPAEVPKSAAQVLGLSSEDSTPSRIASHFANDIIARVLPRLSAQCARKCAPRRRTRNDRTISGQAVTRPLSTPRNNHRHRRVVTATTSRRPCLVDVS
jgi:nucleotidyltransferase/DNA polymerase involved in DNA repair